MTIIHVVCDFDDTLSTSNVARDLLLQTIPEEQVRAIRRQYEAGEITFREYQEQAFDATGKSVAELSQMAATGTRIRPLANELFEAVWAGGGEVAIASAGLDMYILPAIENTLLNRAQLNCGRVTSDPADRAPFRYDYPSAKNDDGPGSCKGDWVTCKCAVIRGLKRENIRSEVVFVGDGLLSDTCAVTNEADTVFARDRLLEYCQVNDIEFTEFNDDFRPVLEYVMENTFMDGNQ